MCLDFKGKLLCLDGYSAHKGKGVHLFLPSLLMCAHVSVFYTESVSAYNLLDLKRLKVLTLLIGSMVVLDVQKWLNCIYLQM